MYWYKQDTYGDAPCFHSSSDTWGGYATATGWDVTNDDGYYVDIPVWLRTSATNGAEISVKAYVIPKNGAAPSTDDALYKAVRVAILDKDAKQITYSSTAIGELPVADGLSSEATTSGKTKYDGKSVLNWYTRSSGIGAGKNAVDSVSDTTATYGDVTEYVANTKIAKLDAPASDASYGIPTQFVVRVWLEGEDPDCWNETAGQDWSINLCFNN